MLGSFNILYSKFTIPPQVDSRDLNATMLHCLGIDHERFSFSFQGLDQRLTGVEHAHVVKGVLG